MCSTSAPAPPLEALTLLPRPRPSPRESLPTPEETDIVSAEADEGRVPALPGPTEKAEAGDWDGAEVVEGPVALCHGGGRMAGSRPRPLESGRKGGSATWRGGDEAEDVSTDCAVCDWATNDLAIRYPRPRVGASPVHDDRTLVRVPSSSKGPRPGSAGTTILRKRDRYREVFDGFDPRCRPPATTGRKVEAPARRPRHRPQSAEEDRLGQSRTPKRSWRSSGEFGSFRRLRNGPFVGGRADQETRGQEGRAGSRRGTKRVRTR